MTIDKFWMALHKMGYQVKWYITYISVEKDGIELATIDRIEENSYALLKDEKGFLNETVVLLIASLAGTNIEERELITAWEMVK